MKYKSSKTVNNSPVALLIYIGNMKIHRPFYVVYTFPIHTNTAQRYRINTADQISAERGMDGESMSCKVYKLIEHTHKNKTAKSVISLRDKMNRLINT